MMLTDLRQALRVILKAPGFTALIVVVLALGIGATTAIFSIVDGVLFKPLPFADPSRLVALQTMTRGEPYDVSYPDLRDWAAQSKAIDRVAAYAENGATFTGEGEADALPVAAVAGDFFETLGVAPLRQVLVHDYQAGLFVLFATVGLVLLIACANVANLLLARGTARRREMAIRTALGASRGRLVRQLLTEAVALAVVGGGAGLLLASWCEAALVTASPLDIPRLHAVHLDGPVLLFALGISVLTALAFGLVPALQVSRAEAGDTLKDEGRGSSGGRSGRMRQTLIIAEIALSFVLLAGAGLLVRSLIRLQQVDPGFVAEHAAAIELMLPHARYHDAAANTAFYHRLLDRLHAIPGVSTAGLSTTLPLSGSSIGVGFAVEGRPDDGTHTQASPRFFAISPDYFAAMRIRLLQGRAFTERDNDTSPDVAIISETIAQRFWPGGNPIRQRIKINYNKTGWREIVGIVGDVKGSTLAEPSTGAVYSPFPQTPWPFMSAVVRTSGDAGALSSALRASVPAIDPMLAPPDVKLLTTYVSHATATSRFTAILIGSFAGLALLLAGFGLYGIMSHHVAQRQREIGIRMALGAQAADVRTLVVSQALRMGLAGLVVGLAGAFAVTRVLGSLLFGVGASDPVTFAGVCGLLLGVILLAAYLPARRATRVDPMVALRAD